MLGAYLCRRKVVLLVALVALHVVAWTSIIIAVQHGRGYHVSRSRTSSRLTEVFETYANYTGPVPLPGPISLPSSLQFVLNAPDACGAERHPDLRILHYIHSAPHHFEQRDFIRRTWGSPRFNSQFKMATVFFLGRTENETLQAQIEEESSRFRDIIQADFLDGYYNLTYKAVFALTWLDQFCDGVEYVLKTDDDVFVDAFRFTSTLFENGTMDNDVHCYAYQNPSPYRSKDSKWRMTKKEYPWKKYPAFCSGMMFYFGGHLVPKLLAAMPHVPFVKIDDVYVTGLLRAHAGLGLKHMDAAVNVFNGETCMQKVPNAEMFCLLDSITTSEDLWIKVMIAEIMARASKIESDRGKYMRAFEDILMGNLKKISEKIKDL